jgi:hypothetical protein
MIPSLRQSSRTTALVVYGGTYIPFYLPFDKEILRHLRRGDVRNVSGTPVVISFRTYKYARRVAFSAILRHRNEMRQLPQPVEKVRKPLQLSMSLL